MLKLDWDFPCACDRCGARSRLRGFPRYLASTLALIAVLVVFYFTAFAQLWTASPVFALLGMAIMVYALTWVHERFLRGLAAWEPAPAAQPVSVEEGLLGWETPLGIALRRNWIYLLGAPLFGPFEFVLVPIYGLPHSVSGIAFFATLLPAFWPIIMGRAPLSFWVVALGLWAAGCVAGIPLADFMKIGHE